VASGRSRRTKVAVLGGGIGAMAAAFELTAPELDGRYDVTVYQPGWRLGGKCASGRGGPHKRIEEHGLHVWFGFYANAFNLIKRCYSEWAPPQASPLKTWEDAFKQCNDIVLFESWKGQWTPWHLYLPPDDMVPGTPHDVSAWEFLQRLLEWLLDQWGIVRAQHGDVIPAAAKHSGRRLHVPVIDTLLDAIGHRADQLEHEAATHFLELALKVAEECSREPGRADAARPRTDHIGRIAKLLEGFKRWLFAEVLEPLIDNEDMRRYAIMLDFWATTVCGMVVDDVFEKGFGRLNGEDLRAWLERHGAEPLTLEHAAFLQGLYDLVFAYREGNKRRPDLAAGKALQAMIRIVVEYKGAVLWKMQAGMGDTVFTPLYDVLRRRGVRFRFFHQVTKLGVSADGSSVASIEVQPQVQLKRRSYDPIVEVGHLRCWPSQPRWKLLENGEELCERGVNFEYECNPLGLAPITLEAGKDFDQVVLGIAVGALPPLCEELAAAKESFKRMLENSDTVMTEGIQLWLTQTATDLGWKYQPAITTSYVTRADTYSNMSQLLPRETWPAGSSPADVVYLCGVLRHDGVLTQADADARVRENALGFLRQDAGSLWPQGCSRDGGEFDWNKLVDDAGGQGAERVDGQFLRANFQPTERYVLTRAGSVEHRLRADQSGFENLKLAGDWTRNGIDGGSVEAAVTSGMQAARAISGSPREIQGERGWLVDD
jgi:uncharacterized protein with NAD-binding domain and iron-sulfur cluster